MSNDRMIDGRVCCHVQTHEGVLTGRAGRRRLPGGTITTGEKGRRGRKGGPGETASYATCLPGRQGK